MYCITRLSVCIGECKQTTWTGDKALETFKFVRGEMLFCHDVYAKVSDGSSGWIFYNGC